MFTFLFLLLGLQIGIIIVIHTLIRLQEKQDQLVWLRDNKEQQEHKYLNNQENDSNQDAQIDQEFDNFLTDRLIQSVMSKIQYVEKSDDLVAITAWKLASNSNYSVSVISFNLKAEVAYLELTTKGGIIYFYNRGFIDFLSNDYNRVRERSSEERTSMGYGQAIWDFTLELAYQLKIPYLRGAIITPRNTHHAIRLSYFYKKPLDWYLQNDRWFKVRVPQLKTNGIIN